MRIHGRAIHPGLGEGRARERDQARRRDPLPPPAGRPLARDDGGTRGLRPPRARRRRLVGGRAALHRPRLRGRPCSTSTSPSCAASPRRSPPPSRAARSRSRAGSSTGTCATRSRTHPEIVANLEEAIRRVGLEPKQTAIRGGTDGSALTEMGLPTPNIFTGGHDAHSEREWICVEDMGLAAATLVELARVWADEQRAY